MGKLRQSTEKIQELLDIVEQGGGTGGEGAKIVFVYPRETSERNRLAYEDILAARDSGKQIVVYSYSESTGVIQIATSVDFPREFNLNKCVLTFRGNIIGGIANDGTETTYYTSITLSSTGNAVSVQHPFFITDGTITEDSSNAAQSRAVKAYVDEKISQGGSIDPELLEGYIPLQRQFSDDFNNDYAR